MRQDITDQVDARALRQFALRAFGAYKGRNIRAYTTEGPMEMHSYWDGGSRDYYQIVELATGRSFSVPENGSGFTSIDHACERAGIRGGMPAQAYPRDGFAVVQSSIFCGKSGGLRVYIHPSNLAKLLPAASSGPAVETNGANGVTITENRAKGGIELRFPSKPSDAVLSRLKSAGWRWSRFSSCWYILKSDAAVRLAAEIAGQPVPPAAPQGEDYPCSDVGYEDQCAERCGL